MSRPTKRNLIATLIIIVGLAGSVLGWTYVPIILLPLIPIAAFFGVAVFFTLYPAAPALERAAFGRTAAGRPSAASRPALRLAGAAAAASPGGPGPVRRPPARDTAPRPAPRASG